MKMLFKALIAGLVLLGFGLPAGAVDDGLVLTSTAVTVDTRTGVREADSVEEIRWNSLWYGNESSVLQTAYLTVVGGGGLLPFVEEDEYACRAGTETGLNSGKNLTETTDPCSNMDEVGRYEWNGGYFTTDSWCAPTEGTATVGFYKPNAWGLYDMHGNVREWCLEWRSYNSSGYRIIRGGSWDDYPQQCCSSAETGEVPTLKIQTNGLRVAGVIPNP